MANPIELFQAIFPRPGAKIIMGREGHFTTGAPSPLIPWPVQKVAFWPTENSGVLGAVRRAAEAKGIPKPLIPTILLTANSKTPNPRHSEGVLSKAPAIPSPSP